MIVVIDIVILVILTMSFIKHYRGRGADINFHSRMLLLCTCLLIANTFALVTALYAYIVIHAGQNEVVNMGRFADRYAMMFAYLALDRIEQRD